MALLTTHPIDQTLIRSHAFGATKDENQTTGYADGTELDPRPFASSI
jgi:hypothetical protein